MDSRPPNAAVTLAESGNLLMMDRRRLDDEDWVAWSRDLIDAGDAAMQAADARDVQGVFDIGEQGLLRLRRLPRPVLGQRPEPVPSVGAD